MALYRLTMRTAMNRPIPDIIDISSYNNTIANLETDLIKGVAIYEQRITETGDRRWRKRAWRP